MRTETITRNLYTFDELSDKAKGKARGWYREASARDTYWSEAVIEDATTYLVWLGFSNVAIQWEGFYMPGSGASFSADWRASDVDLPRYLANYPTHCVSEAKEIGEFAKRHAEEWAKITANAVMHVGEASEGIDRPAELQLTRLCRSLAKQIYATLQTEYEYQNSDECVDETILANEYEFLENGARA